MMRNGFDNNKSKCDCISVSLPKDSYRMKMMMIFVAIIVVLSFTTPTSAFIRPSATTTIVPQPERKVDAQRTKTTTTTKTNTPGTGTTRLFLFDFFNEGKKALIKKIAGEYDPIAIRNRINTLIETNNVLMLSFTTCPYCIKAKSILDDMNASYTVIELDNDNDGKAIRAELGDIIGRTSVPAIWINGNYIGGCNDGGPNGGGIVQLQQLGLLRGMLLEVNAISN